MTLPPRVTITFFRLNSSPNNPYLVRVSHQQFAVHTHKNNLPAASWNTKHQKQKIYRQRSWQSGRRKETHLLVMCSPTDWARERLIAYTSTRLKWDTRHAHSWDQPCVKHWCVWLTTGKQNPYNPYLFHFTRYTDIFNLPIKTLLIMSLTSCSGLSTSGTGSVITLLS